MVIILLHGLGRSRYSMSTMGRALRKAGFEVRNFGYRSLRRSITQIASDLHDYLLREKLADQPLGFVTHSLGGLVVRQLLASYSDSHRILRVVMLGPPNQGAAFARLVAQVPGVARILGPAFRDIAAGRLPQHGPTPEIGVIAGGSGTRGYSPFISGDNDGIVTLDETELPGMKERVVVPGLHSFLMYRSEVQELTIRFLQTGSFQ